MEKGNKGVEAEAMDLASLRLDIGFGPAHRNAPELPICCRVFRMNEIAKRRGLTTGQIVRPKDTDRVRWDRLGGPARLHHRQNPKPLEIAQPLLSTLDSPLRLTR